MYVCVWGEGEGVTGVELPGSRVLWRGSMSYVSEEHRGPVAKLLLPLALGFLPFLWYRLGCSVMG